MYATERSKEHCHFRLRFMAQRCGVIQWGKNEGQGINGEHGVWELGVTEPQGKRGRGPG